MLIIIHGKAMPCCAAPPKPTPKEPPCPRNADDQYKVIVANVVFAFCSETCRERFLSHPNWGLLISSEILRKAGY